MANKRKIVGFLFPFLLVAAFYGGRYLYFQPAYGGGEPAPNFSGSLRDGKPFTLDQMQGTYVLLDFWGSWCGPCRAENPALVQLYQTFHGKSFKGGKDFEIVSVAIERDARRWERAIQKDGLDWPYHILDETKSLRFFDGTIASQYSIREVPSKYLIAPDGTIAMTNPKPGEVAAYLSERIR